MHAFMGSDFEAVVKDYGGPPWRVFSRSLESILQTLKITNRGKKLNFTIDLIHLISGATLVLFSLDVYIEWI